MANILPAFGVGEKLLSLLFGIYIINRFCGSVTALAFLVINFGYLIYVWYKASTFWKRFGVPSPPAWLLFGNIIDYTQKGIHNCDLEYIKKYGKLYGTYFFTQPELNITDSEILKRVLVKDFNNFANRRTFPMSKKSLITRMITVLKDDEWKNVRNAITPAFTSGKLKNTLPLMEHYVKTLCEILSEQTDFESGVDVRKLIGNLTMDVIAAAAFAMDVDAQRNPDNKFTEYAQKLGNLSFKNWQFTLAVIFPWTLRKLDEHFDIRIFLRGIEEFYIENLAKVINERRQSPATSKLDLLQLMLNAADNVKDEIVERDTTIDHGLTPTKTWQLSNTDIVAQCLIFLVGGQETSASTMTFVCYLLAWHPEVQQKCFDEISGLVQKDEAITYGHIQKSMPYLEAVISETLRLYPIFVRFDRVCASDYQLTDTLTIPKGTVICVPVYAIHRDNENYEDPETFDPERFLVEEKKNTNPYAYLPFGYGPRNCIGMRFAQLEMKLALSNVIRKFRIETCSKTEPMPLELDNISLLRAKNPIRLNFKKRVA